MNSSKSGSSDLTNRMETMSLGKVGSGADNKGFSVAQAKDLGMEIPPSLLGA